jgi:hypothetical protein
LLWLEVSGRYTGPAGEVVAVWDYGMYDRQENPQYYPDATPRR